MNKEQEQISEKELALLAYEDTLVGLNCMFEQYGVREVMKDFRGAFPDMFQEVVTQINRLKPEGKVAALLR